MRLWPGLTVLWLCLLALVQPAAASVGDMDTQSADLGEQLLTLAGTAAIFDSPRLQAALRDPQPYLLPTGKSLDPARVLKLLKDAGFRVWTSRPRLWIVQLAPDGTPTVLSADPHLQAEANERSLPVSPSPMAPGDAATLASLWQKPDEGALKALLAQHQADALVMVSANTTGFNWQLQRPGVQRGGQLGAVTDLPSLLPHLLCEELAVPVEWPEGTGRSLLHVGGVGSYADFAALQKTLQQLEGVQGLSLVRVEGSSAWFALDAPTGADLAAALGASGRLTPVPAPAWLKPMVTEGRNAAAVLLSWSWNAAAAGDRAAASAAPVSP